MSVRSSRGPAWEALRLRVLNRDEWLCAYCGKHLEGRDATVDHIVAKVNGGQDIETNLVAACLRCNGLKSGKVMLRQTWHNPRWLPDLARGGAS